MVARAGMVDGLILPPWGAVRTRLAASWTEAGPFSSMRTLLSWV